MAKKTNAENIEEKLEETGVNTENTNPVESSTETLKQQPEETKELIHIDDYLNFYSDLHPVSKTFMRVSVSDKMFRTIEEWQEIEKQFE